MHCVLQFNAVCVFSLYVLWKPLKWWLHCVSVFGMCKFEFRPPFMFALWPESVEKGGWTARLNTALSVMELIVPLVIDIFSNVINGNTKLLKIAPIKYSVQAKYDTQQAGVCKNWYFETLMCWPISVEKGGLVPSTRRCGMMELIVQLVINIFGPNPD